MSSFNPPLFEWDPAKQYAWACFDRITVATITWNRLEHTKAFLDSHLRLAGMPHDLLVIDNGSTDGTLEFLRATAASIPALRVVENGRNVGKARAQKQIRDLIDDGLVVILDNDIRLLSKYWLVHLLKAFHAFRLNRGHTDVAFGLRLLNMEEYGFRHATRREVFDIPSASNSLPRSSYAATSKDGDPARMLDEQVVLGWTEFLPGGAVVVPAAVLKRVRLEDVYPRPIGGEDSFMSDELTRLGVPIAIIENGPIARHDDWPYSDEKIALYNTVMATRAVTDLSYIKWKLRRVLGRS